MIKSHASQTDLVILVADKDMESALVSLLSRSMAIGIRDIKYDIFVHVTQHDPGCCQNADTFLRRYIRTHKHALVIFDYRGCGREEVSTTDLYQQVEQSLRRSGWDDRARVVIIDPELEIWVWAHSPHVPTCLGWNGDLNDLRSWMSQNGLWETNQPKPDEPKKAFRTVLREAQTPKSSRIFADLATSVSVKNCQDSAFNLLCSILRQWFPRDD